MATDVDVQFFSHLNGLNLDNNWGDLIRMLDTCLVNGLPLTSITSASIDAQGDITLNLYAAHNCMLFQIIELTGFIPSELNGKYRIKGTPSANQLILKAVHVGKTISATGAAKLASLGYDIIFRDTNDVNRVYRAKNPTSKHPFIRVDETISDGVNSYDSTYAKYAMVGLLESMEHIDDYENPDVLQLPFDPANPAKNWKITGTGSSVVRGWSKWYWAVANIYNDNMKEGGSPGNFSAAFTICGDTDAFYFAPASINQVQKQLWGCGLYNDALELDTPWFLFATMFNEAANVNFQYGYTLGGSALVLQGIGHNFIATPTSTTIKNHKEVTPIVPNFNSGYTSIYAGTNTPALQIPFFDNSQKLRGSLKHVCFMGKSIGSSHTTVEIAGNVMYVKENLRQSENSQVGSGGIYFYLGELE